MYSYGSVLRELTTRRTPHEGKDYAVILQAHKNKEKEPIPASCSPTVRKLIEDCWQEDLHQRPQAVEAEARFETSTVAEKLARNGIFRVLPKPKVEDFTRAKHLLTQTGQCTHQ